MRTVVVGASSGLGRCIGVGLAQRGARVALLARRREQLERAAEEAGENALPVTCDATDRQSAHAAIHQAVRVLGGLDALVYTPAIGALGRLVDLDAETWRSVFDTNVTGAALVTAAAVPHLEESGGRVIYLSSITASLTPPWPGLGAYAASKAALDKLVEAWQGEHPNIGFTRLVVGNCMGGEGDARTHFGEDWDPDLRDEMLSVWAERGYLSSFIEVDELVGVVDALLRSGPSVTLPTVTVTHRSEETA